MDQLFPTLHVNSHVCYLKRMDKMMGVTKLCKGGLGSWPDS